MAGSTAAYSSPKAAACARAKAALMCISGSAIAPRRLARRGPSDVMSSPMALVRVLQHIGPEGPGRIADAMTERGIGVAVTRPDLGEPVPARLDGAAGLLVMGGPMGVYEVERYPYLADERRLIEHALREEIPVLGVCLGSQLLAATLGARVAPGP